MYEESDFVLGKKKEKNKYILIEDGYIKFRAFVWQSTICPLESFLILKKWKISKTGIVNEKSRYKTYASNTFKFLRIRDSTPKVHFCYS